MPELPEVETFKRYIERTSMERPITKAEVKNPIIVRPAQARDVVAAVEGSEFLSALRHGKQLFLELSRGGWLTWHFGMTGEPVFFERPDDEPRYDRFLFTFEHGYLAFEDPRMLGRIGITSSPGEFVRSKGLGPDALEISKEEFVQTIRGSRGAIKPALLDQGKIAGIGNIYSDEILFQSHIDPRAEISSLDQRDLANMHRNMRRVLRLSIDRGNQFSSFPRTYLLHYRRKGAPCPRCGGTMETMTLGGRTSYYCPACQTRGGR